MAREHRRAEAKGLLEKAGTDLDARGRDIIAQVRQFPDFPETQSRAEVDRKLSARAADSLARYEGIEGGYLVLSLKSFLGTHLLEKDPAASNSGPAGQAAEPAGSGTR